MLQAKARLTAGRSKYTVMFRSTVDGVPTVFTEYVWALTGNEKDALHVATLRAAERLSEELNVDRHVMATRLAQGRKLLTVADGWVSMTSSSRIQHRRDPEGN